MEKPSRGRLRVCLISFWACTFGCSNAAPKVLPVSYAVRTDASGLAERIHLKDSSAWRFRWVEIPRVSGEQRIGPTDSRLLVLATPKVSTLPIKVDSTSKVLGDIELPVNVADSLLPNKFRMLGRRDSTHWNLRDTVRSAPFLPMSWYGEGVALWMGRSILMEFDSH